MAPATFEVIPRERLLDLIDSPELAPVTLITAPAGYGKSTLAHQWAERHAPLTCGWYQIRTEHNALNTFLHHLWRAVDDATGRPEPEPETITVALLLGRLGALPSLTILVLDDYHLVENGLVHQALEQLVHDLPPGTHLFILSRQVPDIPLARLRAYGRVRQIEQSDLAFTFDEVKQVFARADVDDKTLGRLTRKSEGWIAGLQLLLMSVNLNSDSAPRQLDRLIRTTTEHRLLNDYIVEEVLEALPDDLRRFVLDTVVLETLEPELCNYVLQIKRSRRLLVQLEDAVVFVGCPGGIGRSLAYHRLFAECVQRVRLNSGIEPSANELRMRAARWHHAHGNLEAAADYALAAEAWDEAATIICEFIPLDFAHTNVWDSMYWLGRLPETALRKNLPLFQSYITALLGNGYIDKARPLVESFFSAPEIAPTPRQQGWHATQRAYIAFVDGDRDEALYQSYRALGLLPADDASGRLLAWAGIHRESYARGERALAQEALRQAEADHRRQARESIYWHFLMSPDISNDVAIRGELFDAEALNRHFMSLLPAPMQASLGAFKLRLLCIYLEQNRLDLAAVEVEDILAELQERTYLIWSSGALVAVANYYLATGEPERAWETLQHALQVTRQHGGRELIRKAQTGIANYWLQTGQDGLAHVWAGLTHIDPHVIRAFGDVDPRTLHAQMMFREKRYAEALALLDESIGLARSIGNVAAEIQFLVWASVVSRAMGARDEADDSLRRALELGAPGGFHRVYSSTDADLSDAIRALLPTLSERTRHHASTLVGEQAPPEPAPWAGAHLTDREREVLGELMCGKSTREIAGALFITERTVKKHLANLFQKTGTQNRYALAVWGRERMHTRPTPPNIAVR